MAVSRINEAGLNVNQYGNRNVVINGAMRVSQRGTSFTGVTASAYHLDRFQTELTTLGTWTVTQESDGPDGFAHSLKYDCTTADASPASGDAFRLSYKFEGQDLQNLQKGTSSAKDCTLSFYIKSNKTGTGQFNIRDIDNNRGINKTYTINAANTWEYKTITIQGDTTGAISNDNGSSFWLMWVFNSGTDNSSGTFNSDWHTWDWTDINASGTLAIGGSTSDYIQITGVQLEVGDTATDFEHRTFGDELARCQRYYYRHAGVGTNEICGVGISYDSDSIFMPVFFPVSMRAGPSLDQTTGSSYFTLYSGNTNHNFTGFDAIQETHKNGTNLYNNGEPTGMTTGYAGWVRLKDASANLAFDAEL